MGRDKLNKSPRWEYDRNKRRKKRWLK